MKQIFQLCLILIFFSSCNDEKQKDNVYNKTFVVGEIPEADVFEIYNKNDKKLENSGNHLVEKGGYKNNRSRIFMELSTNGKRGHLDPEFSTGMPTPCYSSINKDTLNVVVGLGFFGGFGFEIKIFKDKFQSNYFFYTDDVKPYKYKQTGEFTDNINLQNKFQSLTLNEQPTFKPGQQLTGYLTFTSPNWYESNMNNQLDTNFVKGRIYFTCLTKKN
jgi:hypothetical protein